MRKMAEQKRGVGFMRPLHHLRPRSPSRRNMGGAGLIEVLIAVLVMAIGLLGIAAMQATALRNSQSALERSQGVIGTYSILDAMRANPDGLQALEYNISRTCGASPGGAGSLAQSDIQFWLAQLEENLGEGACGSISCDTQRVCSISVEWDDTRGSGGVDDLVFVMEARL